MPLWNDKILHIAVAPSLEANLHRSSHEAALSIAYTSSRSVDDSCRVQPIKRGQYLRPHCVTLTKATVFCDAGTANISPVTEGTPVTNLVFRLYQLTTRGFGNGRMAVMNPWRNCRCSLYSTLSNRTRRWTFMRAISKGSSRATLPAWVIDVTPVVIYVNQAEKMEPLVTSNETFT